MRFNLAQMLPSRWNRLPRRRVGDRRIMFNDDVCLGCRYLLTHCKVNEVNELMNSESQICLVLMEFYFEVSS